MSKIVKGGPFGLFENPVCCKIFKKLEGDPLETKKISKKSLIAPKKIERGDPLVSSGFVGYVKKVKKMKRVLWRQKNFRKKVAQCRKKIERGTLSVPSGFLGYLEKIKKKGGTFGQSLPWPRTWP